MQAQTQAPPHNFFSGIAGLNGCDGRNGPNGPNGFDCFDGSRQLAATATLPPTIWVTHDTASGIMSRQHGREHGMSGMDSGADLLVPHPNSGTGGLQQGSPTRPVTPSPTLLHRLRVAAVPFRLPCFDTLDDAVKVIDTLKNELRKVPGVLDRYGQVLKKTLKQLRLAKAAHVATQHQLQLEEEAHAATRRQLRLETESHDATRVQLEALQRLQRAERVRRMQESRSRESVLDHVDSMHWFACVE